MNKAIAARTERDRRIRELRGLGLTQRAIADEVGCSRTTVGEVLDPSSRERKRAYYQANAERIKAQVRERHLRNADRDRQKKLSYRRATAAQKAEYDRAYSQTNAERISERRRARYAANRERITAQQRASRAKNPDKRLAARRRLWALTADEENARRRAARDEKDREKARAYWAANREKQHAAMAQRRVRSREGTNKIDRLLSIEYRKAIRYDPCVYCGAPGDHDDHAIPLARGGTDHWWNLQRTCQQCNQRKHTMTHEEFMLSGRVTLPDRLEADMQLMGSA